MIVIPSYKPNQSLIHLVQELSDSNQSVLIINDGSHPDFLPIFEQLKQLKGVKVLHNAVNLGKGAALKLAFNYILTEHPEVQTIVTMDADGQHLPKDVIKLLRKSEYHPNDLILGSRTFDSNVPLRSSFGNIFTQLTFRTLIGKPLKDTQTGLRAIPKELAKKCLFLKTSRYEFELEMLILALQNKFKILEEPIETVYEPGNPTSHFNPIKDSLLIYFVFFRFCFTALSTALLSVALFNSFLVFFSPFLSLATSRVIELILNFWMNKTFVFKTDKQTFYVFTKFLLLVAFMTGLSYLVMEQVHTRWEIPYGIAVLLAQGVLFPISFVLQRVVVFQTQEEIGPTKTDWDEYYDHPFKASTFTRKFTEKVLLKYLRLPNLTHPIIAEFGGANSCFIDSVLENLTPEKYIVVDNNQKGIEKLLHRKPGFNIIQTHNEDILNLKNKQLQKADICFSVGLIEHFDPAGTAEAIQSHFDQVKPGGMVIISVPTPTLLYRFTRKIAEILKLWKFHDERPITFSEMDLVCSKHGKLILSEIIWPIFLTQRIAAYKK